MFLKRMGVEGVTIDKLFIGSILTVHARQLKVVDYGDTSTRAAFAKGKETTFAMIKPDVYMHTGKIIDSIYYRVEMLDFVTRVFIHRRYVSGCFIPMTMVIIRPLKNNAY